MKGRSVAESKFQLEHDVNGGKLKQFWGYIIVGICFEASNSIVFVSFAGKTALVHGIRSQSKS